MHRPTIGLIAVILLAVGIYTHSRTDDAVSAACLRIGAVMSILWFAQPQIRGVPRWLVVSVAVALVLLMRWPKLLVFSIPVFAVLWILRPRAPRGGRQEGHRRG